MMLKTQPDGNAGATVRRREWTAMATERWYWLGLFCLLSLAIHIGVLMKSRAFPVPPLPKQQEIEVALQPPDKLAAQPSRPVEPPKPVAKRRPNPHKDAQPRENDRPLRDARRVRVVQAPRAERKQAGRVEASHDDLPAHPTATPGSLDPLYEEKPLPVGAPSGEREAAPRIDRIAKLIPPPGGGGSPAPGLTLSGKGGAPGPIAPPEDVVFHGGGAGGADLPIAAPRIGGGGGKSILSIENPLARDAVSEEKPGLGPGTGGRLGHGKGGGVGEGREFGIGTRLDGKYALSTLQSKPGAGIGAGQGSGIGTKPPGGGKATGSELPGAGGSGLGYGRGSGVGIGNGSGTGVGDGAGSVTGRRRGVPFGDVAGLLRGEPNGGGGKGGGPGGSGRGAVFGVAPRGSGGSGPMRIVYLLDVSGSMRDGNKIGQAKQALKQAMSELTPKDEFNIVSFFGRVHAFSDDLIPATRGNIEAAMLYVDFVGLKEATNISAALETAFLMERANTFYLMTDGEPTRGITDFGMLRQRVKDLNSRGVQINTLALGLGERFKGMSLLSGIAADNQGKYSYIDLSRKP